MISLNEITHCDISNDIFGCIRVQIPGFHGPRCFSPELFDPGKLFRTGSLGCRGRRDDGEEYKRYISEMPSVHEYPTCNTNLNAQACQ